MFQPIIGKQNKASVQITPVSPHRKEKLGELRSQMEQVDTIDRNVVTFSFERVSII